MPARAGGTDLAVVSASKFDELGLPHCLFEETQTKLSNGMPCVLTASILPHDIGRRLYIAQVHLT